MTRIPPSPLVLGLAGLIPFLWGALTSIWPLGWLTAHWQGFGLLANYAMVILPFMSGVIWGFATRAQGREASVFYVLSVVPALWTFFAVHGDFALAWAAIGFILLLPVDRAALRKGVAPDWWMALRVLLTVVVVACLLTGQIAHVAGA